MSIRKGDRGTPIALGLSDKSEAAEASVRLRGGGAERQREIRLRRGVS